MGISDVVPVVVTIEPVAEKQTEYTAAGAVRPDFRHSNDLDALGKAKCKGKRNSDECSRCNCHGHHSTIVRKPVIPPTRQGMRRNRTQMGSMPHGASPPSGFGQDARTKRQRRSGKAYGKEQG